MIQQDQVQQIIGSTAYDVDGDKIGKVGQVYFDDATGEPDWATVNTGFFGSSESFVPIRDAEFTGDRLVVHHDADKVKNAPNVGDDTHLTPDEEQSLYQHYGIGWDTGTTGTQTTGTQTTGTVQSEGYDTSGPTTDNAMTRSEEHVQVGTTSQEAGRARLRKYVETEQVQQTVPVTKERAVVHSEPITDANVGDATGGPAISEEEHELVLNEEKVVVQKSTEPVERVSLGTEQVTEEQTVTEEVQKERIAAEGDVGTTGTTGR